MKDDIVCLEKDVVQEAPSRDSQRDAGLAVTDVLIIDESENVRALLADFVCTGRPSWQVRMVASVEEGLELAEHVNFDCVVLASANRINLARLSGFYPRNFTPMAIVVLEETVGCLSLANQNGALSVLPKWDITQELFCAALESQMERANLLQLLELQTRELDAHRNARAAYTRNYNEFAHEMLTPLSVVQEFISLVFDGVAGPTTEQQRKYLAYARGDCSNIRRLVDSKVTAGELNWMRRA